MDETTRKLFSDRMRRRGQLWWGYDVPRDSWRAIAAGLHRVRIWHIYRDRRDPIEAWRCCANWPHSLIHKWNSREFAARHGCRIPAIYWRGRFPHRAPFDSFPPDLVVRPVNGKSREGAYVVSDGRELLRDIPITIPELRRRLRRERWVQLGAPVLVEEILRRNDGAHRLPLELKCHTFGDVVACIEVVQRGDGALKQRYYTTDWVPFDDRMDIEVDVMDPIPAPPALDELLRLATSMGAEIGTYIRIDFFLAERGWVFNEFSSTPSYGLKWTPFCEAYLGRFWEERFPEMS